MLNTSANVGDLTGELYNCSYNCVYNCLYNCVYCWYNSLYNCAGHTAGEEEKWPTWGPETTETVVAEASQAAKITRIGTSATVAVFELSIVLKPFPDGS